MYCWTIQDQKLVPVQSPPPSAKGTIFAARSLPAAVTNSSTVEGTVSTPACLSSLVLYQMGQLNDVYGNALTWPASFVHSARAAGLIRLPRPHWPMSGFTSTDWPWPTHGRVDGV